MHLASCSQLYQPQMGENAISVLKYAHDQLNTVLYFLVKSSDNFYGIRTGDHGKTSHFFISNDKTTEKAG